MPPGSKRFKSLIARTDQLRNHLLYFLPDPPVSRLSYSDQELDCTRAYTVLAHAEMEAFCEDLTAAKVQSAKSTYDATGIIRPLLRRVVSYHVTKKGKSWQDVLRPPAEIVNSAFQSYSSVVRDNNGIKQINLEKLLFPIGIHEAHLSSTWLAQMNSFGTDRGGLAHSSIRVQQPPDPLSQLKTVNQLLQGLLDLDKILGRLR